MKTLKDLFLAELSDMYDAEHRIIKALPKLAKAATSEKLKIAFLAHLDETKGHVTRLEKVFQSFGEKAQGKTCEATVGLLKEGFAPPRRRGCKDDLEERRFWQIDLRG